MHVDLSHHLPEFLTSAQLTSTEDLFTFSPPEKKRVDQLFEKAKISLEFLANTPIRSLQKTLASSHQDPFTQTESIYSVWEKFSLAIDTYVALRRKLLNRALLYTLFFSYLHSLQIDFHLVLEEGALKKPLPYDRLQELPEWPDYVSYFYTKKLTVKGLQRHFSLSRKLQEHLQDFEKARMTLLEFFCLLSYKVSPSEAHALARHDNVHASKLTPD